MTRFLQTIFFCLSALTLEAQDFSHSLEGITRVLVMAETNILIKADSISSFLIRDSENYRTPLNNKNEGLRSLNSRGEDNTNYGVNVKREGELLIVNGLRDRRASNLVIHLPKSMNILAESLENNDIYIDGFEAEVEAINHLGNIIIANVTGPVVAENTRGNINVLFSNLSQSSPISIVASNGDIDISMPIDSKASITSKNYRGEFFTDFDEDLLQQISFRKGSKSTHWGLNGGGVDISLQNELGNVYLREVGSGK